MINFRSSNDGNVKQEINALYYSDIYGFQYVRNNEEKKRKKKAKKQGREWKMSCKFLYPKNFIILYKNFMIF